MTDRNVHASFPGLGEVVRYDRAGKWYIEPASGKREHVTVAEAAARAVALRALGGEIFFGVPGGDRFEHLVQKVIDGGRGESCVGSTAPAAEGA